MQEILDEKSQKQPVIEENISEQQIIEEDISAKIIIDNVLFVLSMESQSTVKLAGCCVPVVMLFSRRFQKWSLFELLLKSITKIQLK